MTSAANLEVHIWADTRRFELACMWVNFLFWAHARRWQA